MLIVTLFLAGNLALAQGDLNSLNKRATYYCARGRYLEAEPLVKQTLSPAMANDLATDPLYKAIQLFSYGGVEFGLRHYVNSQAAYAQGLKETLRSPGRESEKLIGDIYRQLGSVALERADLSAASTYYQKALQIHTKLFGQSNPESAFDWLGVGATYARQRAFSQAEAALKQNIAMTEQAFGKEGTALVASCETMASVLKQTNRAAEAKQWEMRAQAIRARHSPWDQESRKAVIDRQYWIFPENPFFPTFN